MTISAKVIAASQCAGIAPIVTMELRYPRFIHAEFMTHRVFSRNASSSRAVPVKKMIQDVIDDPAMPVRWGANQPGMQDAGDHDAEVLVPHIHTDNDWDDFAYLAETDPVDAWERARDIAVEFARGFADAGYHKQVVNRLLEPFAHITVIVTATEWKNFFDLRCHPAADPTMRALAEAMREAYEAKTPDLLHPGYWHLPYITEEDWLDLQEAMSAYECFEFFRKVSAARCARVSYLNHDGSKPEFGKDIELAERLLADRHMSPFEHQATPDCNRSRPSDWGNFNCWVQFRKLIEGYL